MDIRQSILFNTDKIETLSSLCKVDKISQNICSNRYFWQLYFAKYDLPLPEDNYRTADEWIYAFITARTADDILRDLEFNAVSFNYNPSEPFDILLIGDIDNDKSILEFINHNIKYVAPGYYYKIGIFKTGDRYNILYAVYGDRSNRIIKTFTVKINDDVILYKYLYKIIYNGINVNKGLPSAMKIYTKKGITRGFL